MPIETIELSDSKYFNYLRGFTNQNWILCVGAGICKGILPDWFDLTLNLVNTSFGSSWSRAEFKVIFDEVGFSLDGWIQGCYNNLKSQGKSISEFNELLENALYGELLNEAAKSNVKDEVILLFESPKNLKKKQLLSLCDFFETKYSKTTLMQIVKALLAADAKSKLPSAIITFNADSLLHSLIVLFSIKNHYTTTGSFKIPKEPYRKVTRTFQSWAESIPIFHLHGSISPTTPKTKNTSFDSRDSLIFLESSYTDVASNMYSWAQTNFLYSAQNSKLVFLGLSMSDPNIRRWLSWTNQAYNDELNFVTGGKATSLSHLWIRTKASNIATQSFLDVSLRHMGVKIGLIEDWGKVEETMLKIM